MWKPPANVNGGWMLADLAWMMLFSPAVDKPLREVVSKLLPSVLDSCSQTLLYIRIIWEAVKTLDAQVAPQTN